MENHTVDYSFSTGKAGENVFLGQNPLINYNNSKDSQENVTRYSRRLSKVGVYLHFFKIRT